MNFHLHSKTNVNSSCPPSNFSFLFLPNVHGMNVPLLNRTYYCNEEGSSFCTCKDFEHFCCTSEIKINFILLHLSSNYGGDYQKSRQVAFHCPSHSEVPCLRTETLVGNNVGALEAKIPLPYSRLLLRGLHYCRNHLKNHCLMIF